jgi:putative endonuclease
MKQYFVYILASKSRALYTGITNNLERRLHAHKNKLAKGFTEHYKVDQLVYFETTPNVKSAIEREKQIKAWTRARRVALIERTNPHWKDLSETWAKE